MIFGTGFFKVAMVTKEKWSRTGTGILLLVASVLQISGCAHNTLTHQNLVGGGESSNKDDHKILALINGMYEVVSWNDGSKTHLPPAVSGRWVFLDGHVMSIIHNRTDPQAHQAAIGWGEGTVKESRFLYRYPERITIKGSTQSPSIGLESPWEGMRSFAVKWKGDSIEMTSQSGKQTWVISPSGMLYTDRAWGPQKVFAQRRWKRVSR